MSNFYFVQTTMRKKKCARTRELKPKFNPTTKHLKVIRMINYYLNIN